MKCPICGGADLVHETRNVPYTYKGKSTTFRSIEGDYCPACGEGILSRGAIDHFGELAQEFQAGKQRVLRGPSTTGQSSRLDLGNGG